MRLKLFLAISLFLLIIPIASASHTASLTITYQNPDPLYETQNVTFIFELYNKYTSRDNIDNFTTTLPNFTINSAYRSNWVGTINGSTVVWTRDNYPKIFPGTGVSSFEIKAIADSVNSDLDSTWIVETQDDDNHSNLTTAGPITIKNDINRPTINNVLPTNKSFKKNESTTFQIDITENETGVKSADVIWDDNNNFNPPGKTDDKEKLECIGSIPSYTCSKVLNLGDMIEFNNYYINYYFNVSDKVGNVNRSRDYVIFVDTEAPSVDLKSNPSLIQTDSYTFVFNMTDNSFNTLSEGFVTNINCGIYIDNILSNSTEPVGNKTSSSLKVDFASIADDNHIWYVTCTDDAGWNGTSEIRYFTRDINAPTITLSLPVNKGFIPDIYNFTWIATDIFDDELICNLTIDGSIVEANIISPKGVAISSEEIVAEGPHNWSVTCWDDIPNYNISETWNFTVDITPPVVTLISPDDGVDILSEAMTFEFNTTDDFDDIMNCILYVNNEPIKSKDDVPKKIKSDFTYNKASEGEDLDWYISCSDELQSAQSKIRMLHLDTFLAESRFGNEPFDLSTSEATMSINFTIQFNETIENIIAKLNGTEVLLTTDDNKLFKYNGTLNSSQDYNLSVQATDLYGHSNSGQNTYTITYNPPTTPSPPPSSPPSGGRFSYSGYEDELPISSGDCGYTWTCDDWSECIDGTQTRTCTNMGECLGDKDKPPEERTCTVPETPEETPAGGLGITGWFVGGGGELNYKNILITLGLVALTAAMGLVGRFYKKKRESYYDDSDLKF